MRKHLLLITLFSYFFISYQLYSVEWVRNINPIEVATFAYGGLAAYDTNNFIIAFRVLDLQSNPQTWGFRHLRTTDYGKTWDSVFSTEKPMNESWNWEVEPQYHYISKDSIYFLSILEPSLMLFARTYDGGKSWDTNFVHHSAINGHYREMHFRNSKDGIVAARSDTLLRTTDAGRSWFPITIPSPEDGRGFSVRFLSGKGDMILMLAYRPVNPGDTEYFKKIYFSNDFGDNWIIVDDDSSISDFYADMPTLRSENEWWMAGQKDPTEQIGITFLKRTTDQGETWEVIENDEFRGVGKRLFFFDDPNKIIFHTLGMAFRSTDNGNSWVEIPGKPSNNSQIYRAVFPSFTKGMFTDQILYYVWRLETPTSVNEFEASNITLYPNPTRDILHIRTDELISRVELSDVIGNVVKVQTSESQTSDVYKTSDVLELNVENLPAGMYFLNLYTMSGEVLVEKVIVGF